MKTISARFLLFTCLLSIISGCATKDSLFCLTDLEDVNTTEDNSLLDSENSAPPPTELLPQPVEAEKCISQELDALRQTGSWEVKEKLAKDDDQKYDFPVVVNKQVKMYLDLFQNKQRKYFSRWLSRSTKYLPLIHQELEKAGLPKDLAYLAMIESGYNQRAYSKARAVGLWQFMKYTGLEYDLKIDRYVDERRNALKSTKAAIAFLSDLYDQFGDWHLAVAAYNAGPGKIRSGLRKYKTKDFWKLAEKKFLRLETKRYVPKLIAAIIVAKDPDKYGFSDTSYDAPLEYDTIEVKPGLSLNALALITGGTKKQLSLLNQELKTGMTPPNKSNYQANIPKGTYDVASSNLSRLRSVVKTGYKTHIIKKKETLTTICRKYGVNKTTILKVNNLRNGKLRHGQRLRIPYSIVDYQLRPKQGSAVAKTEDSLILHTIKPGETIGKIAKKYSVPEDMIVAWNGLKNSHRIWAGQQLALYVINENKSIASTPRNIKVTSKKLSSKNNNNLIVLSESRKTAPEETKPMFSLYKVKQGDTLWNISRRFKTSPKKIKLWNNLKSNLIYPGSKLKMKGV